MVSALPCCLLLAQRLQASCLQHLHLRCASPRCVKPHMNTGMGAHGVQSTDVGPACATRGHGADVMCKTFRLSQCQDPRKHVQPFSHSQTKVHFHRKPSQSRPCLQNHKCNPKTCYSHSQSCAISIHPDRGACLRAFIPAARRFFHSCAHREIATWATPASRYSSLCSASSCHRALRPRCTSSAELSSFIVATSAEDVASCPASARGCLQLVVLEAALPAWKGARAKASLQASAAFRLRSNTKRQLRCVVFRTATHISHRISQLLNGDFCSSGDVNLATGGVFPDQRSPPCT